MNNIAQRILVALFLFSPAALSVAEPTRERISINDGWRFHKGDPTEVAGSLDYLKIRDWVLKRTLTQAQPA